MSESESEEFFDAEDSTPVRVAEKPKTNPANAEGTKPVQKEQLTKQCYTEESDLWEIKSFPIASTEKELAEAKKRAEDDEKRRRKIEEQLQRMHADDNEAGEPFVSSTGSIRSFGSILSCGDDVSLGRIGSILGGIKQENVDAKSCSTVGSSLNSYVPSEPDIVASTKGDGRTLNVPIAPPRTKKKRNAADKNKKVITEVVSDLPELPASSSSSENTKEASDSYDIHSLDLQSAMKGLYVVKPQDREQDRAERGLDQTDDPIPEPKDEKRLMPADFRADRTPEGSMRTSNLVIRTRSDSGRLLSDMELLEQIRVVNLDTGEQLPLSTAEDQLPRCINPLSLHIMRLTSEYVTDSALEKQKESDEESVDLRSGGNTTDVADVRRVWRKRVKSIIGKTVQTVHKIKSEVKRARHDDGESTDEEVPDGKPTIKMKVAGSHKGPYVLDSIREVQDLSGEHCGAVWAMKFSTCGRLMATAGQDHQLRIWVVKSAYTYFDDMRQKYNSETKVSPAQSHDSVSYPGLDETLKNEEEEEEDAGPFMSKPFFVYEGHTADVLDVSWSKNYFILSSSMDKTVRLWHISRKESLCCFQHIDFVTAIAFHPRDERYFLSGSLDGKLRLWNIPDKKVARWNELDGTTKLITAISFYPDGNVAVVGSYDGRCTFYSTDKLKYHTQIHVRSSKTKKNHGRKITGIEPMPGEDKILVTSNDSRLRLYDKRDLTLLCKYKGCVNVSSQIRGHFSHDGKYIICGSENQFIYLWKSHYDYSKFSSARRDKNNYWEAVKAHNAVVTAAIFSPNPNLILQQLENLDDPSDASTSSSDVGTSGFYVICSADFTGSIKVFITKPKSKS